MFNYRLLSGGISPGNSNLKGARPTAFVIALIFQLFTVSKKAAMAASLAVSITGQTSFCPGNSTSLTASVSGCSNSASYIWRRNGVFMPGASTATISVSDAGKYTVTVTCGSGSATSTEFNLTTLTLLTNVQNACPGSVGNVNLRVFNGRAPFTYIWNNSATSQDLTGLSSGNYSVSVKDANGCVASTIATVTNTPVNVSAGSQKEICSGGSAQLQATGADLYFWSPSTGLSSTVESNPVASPSVTTSYTVTGYIASGELVTNGTFNQGNVGFGSDYGFVGGLATAAGYSSGTGLYPEGKYAIVTNRTDSSITKYHPAFVGFGHNKGNAVGRNDDRYLAINGSTTLDQAVWKQSVEVVPGNKYSFSCWITSLLSSNPSKLRFLINGVEIGPRIEAPGTLYTWKQFFAEWNSGSATTADIAIINDNLIAGGNDFGLDDISFSTTCTNTSTVLVTVVSPVTANTINCPPSSTFCLSGDAGIITGNNPLGGNGNYAYQWQISIDNTNWSDIQGATSSSYDPGTVFATSRFRRLVKSGSCSLESNVCTITITAGNTISNNTITAPGTSAFCSSGDPAVISGSTPSGGGTGTFVYTWLSSPNGNDFTEITGAKSSTYNPGVLTQTTYFRRIVSKGNCNSNASNVVEITINQKPELSLVSSANLCGSGRGSMEVNSPGAAIKWYETSISTTVIGTGSVFTSPNLSSSAIYYAQATLNNCVSDRLAVNATVKALPTVVSTSGGSTCGIGNVTVSAVPSAGTIAWYSSASEGSLLGTGNSLNLNQIAFNSTVYAEAQNDGCISAQRSAAMVEFNNPSSSETTLSACGSQVWNGETYTASGDYSKQFTNAAGCDSTAILHLTIRNASSSETTISACGSQVWNGETYTASGDYSKQFTNAAGCDSTAILHLTIRNTSSYSFEASINSGANYVFFDRTLTTAGEYTKTILNKAGCDSLITLTLTVIPVQGCSSIYAEEVVGFRQGKCNNGAVISAARSNPALALGAPQNNETLNFVSLGFGGEITLKFCKAIKNGPGADVKVVETTWGGTYSCANNPEKIRAFASQDGCRFVYIGEGCQDSEFDLGSLPWTQYIRLVDISPLTGSKFAGLTVGDAFDVDGLVALNGFEENPLASPFVAGANQAASYTPGKCKNGSSIPVGRSIASRALGIPQRTDVVNFVSLGFGGSLTLKFDYAVVNNPSAFDLQVVETSYGNPTCNAYPEKATFEGSLDGLTWTILGDICQDGSLELGSLSYIHYLRITDVSDKSKFSAAADGYDVDGVLAINQPCGSNTRLAISDMIEDDIETPDEAISGSIFPNPASEKATLLLEGSRENESWNIRMVDMTGKVVFESNFFASNGNSEFPLEVAGLPKGIFQVIATNGQTKLSMKLNH